MKFRCFSVVYANIIFWLTFSLLFFSCSQVRVYDADSKQKALDLLQYQIDKGDWNKALNIADEILQFSPHDCQVLSKRLYVYSNLNKDKILHNDIRNNYNRCSESADYLENAYSLIKKFNDYELEYYLLKNLHRLAEDDSFKELRELALERYCVELTKRALKFREEGDKINLHKEIDNILDLDPNFIFAHRLKAHLFYEEESYDKSLSSLEKIFEIDNTNEKDLELYAEILYLTGEKGRALETYRKILNLYPFNPEALKRSEELSVGIERDNVLESLIRALRYKGSVRLDELSAIIYFYFYDQLSQITVDYKIILDIEDNPYRDYIEFLVFRNILDIDQRRLFMPSRAVTKALLSSAFYNILRMHFDTDSLLHSEFRNKYRDINSYHIYFDIVRVIDYYKLIDPKRANEFDITEIMHINNILEYLERLKVLIIDKEKY